MPTSRLTLTLALALALSIAAILIGVVAWEAAIPQGTRKEAWDLPVYWQIAYPVMVAGSFVLSILGPTHPVRWGLLVGLGQGVWSLIVTSLQKGIPNLLPLGLIMFAILSLPCIAAAWVERLARPPARELAPLRLPTPSAPTITPLVRAARRGMPWRLRCLASHPSIPWIGGSRAEKSA